MADTSSLDQIMDFSKNIRVKKDWKGRRRSKNILDMRDKPLSEEDVANFRAGYVTPAFMDHAITRAERDPSPSSMRNLEEAVIYRRMTALKKKKFDLERQAARMRQAKKGP